LIKTKGLRATNNEIMANILVVDDELGMRQFLTHLLQREGHVVRVAANGREALDLLREPPPDLIISDIRMPDMGGVDLLRAAREMLPDVEVIMMTAFANVDTAREAFLLGAYDFVQKPFDNDLLKETVTRALEKISLVKEKEALLEENKALIHGQRTRGKLGNIIGQSGRMDALFQMIETVSQVPSTVLVTGESGTGKELVARAIHDLSPRAEKPFVSVNCGAFTETLLESELFGYVKGSFTGANTNRKGLFEAANSGTIFLDEIGEMSPAMQVKLLRVLQEREFERLGGVETIKVNVRLIVATNKDLEEAIKRSQFREDLYYRLNVFTIFMPPLRERKPDILLLAEHFVEKFEREHGKSIKRISTPAIDMLTSYHWPGNVRELENVIERAVLICDSNVIHGHHLPPSLQTAEGSDTVTRLSLTSAMEAYERDLIQDALKTSRGNRAKAAKLLDSTERIIGYKVKKYGLRCERFRS